MNVQCSIGAPYPCSSLTLSETRSLRRCCMGRGMTAGQVGYSTSWDRIRSQRSGRGLDADDGPHTFAGAVVAGMIGYYVHHHGRGHLSRYERISAATSTPMTALSELAIPGGLLLSSDTSDGDRDHEAGGALHWAPIAAPGIGRRTKSICDWVVDNTPLGAVVDVSVEAALLFRLLGVPTVVVRQHGDRTDPAHESAYRSAVRLLAPFPEALEHRQTPEWIVAKTDYSGFVTSSAPDSSGSNLTDLPQRDDVVVLWGRGGGELPRDCLEALLEAVTPRKVWCIGDVAAAHTIESDRLVDLGWRTAVAQVLVNAPTVVASAGNNTVADAARAGCALVAVSQSRPFREQERHAESLDRAKVAAVLEPDGRGSWPQTISLAQERRSSLEALAAGDGALAAARAIETALTDSW